MTRKLLVASLLLGSLLMFGTALAAKAFCRSDPFVQLSNGVVVELAADIGAPIQTVREVHYELHGPIGTSVTSLRFTPTWKKNVETFSYFADQAAGQYYAVTTVHMVQSSQIKVVAYIMQLTQGGHVIGTVSGNGVAEAPITVRIRI